MKKRLYIMGFIIFFISISLFSEDNQSKSYDVLYLENELKKPIAFEDKLKISEKLEKDNYLSDIYKDQKKYKESEEIYKKLAKKDSDRYSSDVAREYENLAVSYINQKKYKESEDAFNESLKIYKRLENENPDKYSSDVARQLSNIANLYREQKKYKGSEKRYIKSIEIYKKLAKKDSDRYSSDVAIQYVYLAVSYINQKKYKESEDAFNESLKIYKRLENENPDKYSSDVAIQYGNLAIVYKNQKKYKESEDAYKESLKIYKRLENEDSERYSLNVAREYDNLAVLYKKQKKYKESEDAYKESLKIYKRLENEDSERYSSNVAIAYKYLARLYADENRFKESEEAYKRSLEIFEKLTKKNPERYSLDVAREYDNLAVLYKKQSRFKESEKAYIRSLEIYQRLVKENLETHFSSSAVREYDNLAVIYKKQNRSKESEEAYNRSLETYKALPRENLEIYNSSVAIAYHNLAVIYKKQNRFKESEEAYNRSLELYKKLEKDNPGRYSSTIKEIENMMNPSYSWSWIFVNLFIIIFLFLKFHNIKFIENQTLLEINYTKLKSIQKKLKLTGNYKSALEQLYISEESYKKAISFAESDDKQKVKIFCERVGAKYKKEGEFYRITLAENFPLQIGNFLLLITQLSAKEIKNKLDTTLDKVFVINDDFVVQNELYKLSIDKTNRIIAPKADGITKILLDPNPRDILSDILVEHLLLKDISPYQTNDGINSEANFFGMKDTISSIINTEPKNYIIVGGRQLGKSSLLKALYRRYSGKEDIDSYYITLSSSDIVGEICNKIGLENLTIEVLEKFVLDAPKRIVFLVDEADKFIKEEKENDYKITESFRKLSQERKANFIITGFWTLYDNVYNDYQAPFKNFAEIIQLEGLEKEACREIMIEPMARIGISYEDEKNIDLFIERCGQRANLIAITCSKVLKQLDGKVITSEDIGQVVKNQNLEDYLKGWGALSSDKKANRLDRIIIYLTLEKNKFRLKDVIEGLQEQDLTVDIVDVEDSLSRLTLAYVIGKKQGNYFYRVPLFVEKMLENDIEILLDGDVEGYRLT